jgi:hypothetical protein
MATFSPRLTILPAEQRALWPELKPARDLDYVLYGGTAIALRLGHRQSIDFDFFRSDPLDRDQVRKSLPFVNQATVLQDSLNTFVVMTKANVKISFFGGLDFGRVGEPQLTDDAVLRVASLRDLMATKLKVILQRSESKDYIDIAAMVRSGESIAGGLAAAEKMFSPTFPPSESLRALVYFEEGDMSLLSQADREVLTQAAAAVRKLPAVTLKANLCSAKTRMRAHRKSESAPKPKVALK